MRRCGFPKAKVVAKAKANNVDMNTLLMDILPSADGGKEDGDQESDAAETATGSAYGSEHEGLDASQSGREEEGDDEVLEEEQPAEEDHGPLPEPDWSYWWVTRSNRNADCFGCGTRIEPLEFRVSFYPSPGQVEDPRKWGLSGWRFYHVDGACVFSAHRQLHMMEEAPAPKEGSIVLDCARTPESRPETDEEFAIGKANCAAALFEAYERRFQGGPM